MRRALCEGIASSPPRPLLVSVGPALRLNMSPSCLWPRFEARLFHRVLINLLESAIEFGASGTPVPIGAVRSRDNRNLFVLRQ